MPHETDMFNVQTAIWHAFQKKMGKEQSRKKEDVLTEMMDFVGVGSVFILAVIICQKPFSPVCQA